MDLLLEIEKELNELNKDTNIIENEIKNTIPVHLVPGKPLFTTPPTKFEKQTGRILISPKIVDYPIPSEIIGLNNNFFLIKKKKKKKKKKNHLIFFIFFITFNSFINF